MGQSLRVRDWCRVAAACLLLSGWPALTAAQAPPAQAPPPQTSPAAATAVPEIPAVRTTGPIVINGRLDEADWKRASVATNLVQRDPDEGKPASERTEVRVLYDDDALYIGARMFDRDPGKIARRLTRRDAGTRGIADTLFIGLDPHHDHLTGSLFAVTAAGSQIDGFLFNDSDEDDSWDGVWQAAVSIDDQGWTAEMRIPFSQLRFPAGDHQTWGFQVVRTIVRTNEEDWWAFAPKKDSAVISRSGHLTGLDGVRSKRHLDLLPYATARGDSNGTVESGNPFTSRRSANATAGLDAKWGVTSNITVDATVNPDFGQVEVDPAVVNLTAFETFYDEKRPFFIEGSDVFNRFGRNGASGSMGFNRSNPTLFYSRRIGRSPQGVASGDFVDLPQSTTIIGAAKITGKTARGWTINFIDAVTSREWADVANGSARSRVEVEPLTNYLAARVRREFGNRAGVGMLATVVSRDLRAGALQDRIVDSAYVAGIDGHVFLNTRLGYVITGAISASQVSGSASSISRLEQSSARYYQRPDATHLTFNPAATSLSGWNLQTDFTRNNGNLRPNVSVWAVSPGYETNDVGYMTSADRYGMHAGIVWLKTTPDRFSRSRNMIAAKWYVWNFAGNKVSDGVYVSGSATFRNYWSANASAIAVASAYSDRLTRGGPMMRTLSTQNYSAGINSDSRKALVLSLNGSYSISRSGGWDSSGDATITVKPVPALTIELGPAFTRSASVAQYITSTTDPAAVATFGKRYVFGNLGQTEWSMTTRANVMLTPRMSFQLFAQPLLSVGRYGGFKQAAMPRTFTFQRFGIDLGTIGFDPAADLYTVDPRGGGTGLPFSFGNPDFNFKSLRVNAVFRWEFKPGSTVYLVWTQQREDYARPGQFAFGSDLSSMVQAPSNNVVMVKVSYWLGR